MAADALGLDAPAWAAPKVCVCDHHQRSCLLEPSRRFHCPTARHPRLHPWGEVASHHQRHHHFAYYHHHDCCHRRYCWSVLRLQMNQSLSVAEEEHAWAVQYGQGIECWCRNVNASSPDAGAGALLGSIRSVIFGCLLDSPASFAGLSAVQRHKATATASPTKSLTPAANR